MKNLMFAHRKQFFVLLFSLPFFLNSLGCSPFLFGEEPINNAYGYVSVGLGPLPFPIPTINGGFRSQSNEHGVDLNAAFAVIAPERMTIKMAPRYLHYLAPQKEKPWYLGIGPQISPIFNADFTWSGLGVSPEFLFGREYQSSKGKKRFWEVVIDFPLYSTNEDTYKWGTSNHMVYFPYIFVQYGWGF